MPAYFLSPRYCRGQVYVVKDGGMASCYDAKTGKIAYKQERLNALGNYYASPVAADGRHSRARGEPDSFPHTDRALRVWEIADWQSQRDSRWVSLRSGKG